MLKILGRITSSNVQKVVWCCEELGIAYERQDIGGNFGGTKTPEYLAMNPNALVPTIDDDGFILWESNAIVRYLGAKHGMGTLFPADLKERADADRWMDWQQTTLGRNMALLFRAHLKSPPDVIDAGELANAKKGASENWSVLGARLGKQPFVAGSSLTMADIALGNAVHRWFKLPIERPSLPNVKAWYDRLCARPAYKKNIADV